MDTNWSTCCVDSYLFHAIGSFSLLKTEISFLFLLKTDILLSLSVILNSCLRKIRSKLTYYICIFCPWTHPLTTNNFGPSPSRSGQCCSQFRCREVANPYSFFHLALRKNKMYIHVNLETIVYLHASSHLYVVVFLILTLAHPVYTFSIDSTPFLFIKYQ